MKLLPILTALTLAAVGFAQSVDAKPRSNQRPFPPIKVRDVYRNDFGWHSVWRENGRKTYAVTGVEGRRNATVIWVNYNRDGSVRESGRMNLSR